MADNGEVEYTSDISTVHSAELEGFFVGWPDPPAPDKHLALLRGSDQVVLARLPGGQVIGFVTAISDGELSAYIPFLEVLPNFQRRGIGTELVRRLIDSLSGHYMIDVCCDAELEPFYRRFGMAVLDRGMGIRNRPANFTKPS